jgi:hypothetical protein
MDFDLSTAAGQAVAVVLQPKIDALTAQARQVLAQQTKRPVQQITDLEVARYLTNLPTADMTDRLAEKADLATKSLRNAVLIGCGTLAIAIVVGSYLRGRQA